MQEKTEVDKMREREREGRRKERQESEKERENPTSVRNGNLKRRERAHFSRKNTDNDERYSSENGRYTESEI